MEEILVKLAETKCKLQDVINKAELPAALLAPILKNFCYQLENQEQEQFEISKKVMVENRKKEKNKND